MTQFIVGLIVGFTLGAYSSYKVGQGVVSAAEEEVNKVKAEIRKIKGEVHGQKPQ